MLISQGYRGDTWSPEPKPWPRAVLSNHLYEMKSRVRTMAISGSIIVNFIAKGFTHSIAFSGVTKEQHVIICEGESAATQCNVKKTYPVINKKTKPGRQQEK